MSDALGPLWCADDTPHGEHWRTNQFGLRDYCTGRPDHTGGAGMTAQESLAQVIDGMLNEAGLDTNGAPYADDGEVQWPVAAELRDRLTTAVVAFLTSDEAVGRAATRLNELHAPLLGMTPEVAFEPWEFDMARAAILAALGVESLPLDPVSEAELICGDYPAPCNHDPAHKRRAE